MKKSFTLILGLCATFSLQKAVQAAGVPANSNYHGLYVIINPKVTPEQPPKTYGLYLTALANPDIDGATLVTPWSILYDQKNPGSNNYDWEPLDSWLKTIIAHHKKISLGIFAGASTPEWLYRPPYSVPSRNFTFNAGPVVNHRGVTRRVPLPWDPKFLEAYDQMIADLSQHLKNIGAYDNVSIAKLEGLNSITEELGLGVTRQVDYDYPLHDSEYLTPGWAKAGFTPNKVLGAWKDLTTHIAAAFPGKLLSVDILDNTNAFPPINNSGQIVSPPPGGTDALTPALLRWILQPGPDQPDFCNRLSVQWNALANLSDRLEPGVLNAGKMGATIAWQMNERLGAHGGSGYIGSNGQFLPCQTPDQYQAMLDDGISLGGQFIEVWAPNVAQFPAALHEPHLRLAHEP